MSNFIYMDIDDINCAYLSIEFYYFFYDITLMLACSNSHITLCKQDMLLFLDGNCYLSVTTFSHKKYIITMSPKFYHQTMHKSKKPNLYKMLPSIITDIEKSYAYRNITVSKVKFMQNRIVELGAYKKKKFLPFKEGLKRILDKKNEMEKERKLKINVGLLKKNKLARRKILK